MLRNQQAAKHLLDGLSPSEIAIQMGISLASVRQYLCMQVGEGTLRRADIAYNISERNLINDALREASTDKVCGVLLKAGHKISREVIDFYLIVRDTRPDLYALMGAIEVWLHRFVQEKLESSYGRSAWWREGVPEAIRVSCQTRREGDPTPLDDPFQYTNFIDLKTIIDRNWRIFVEVLPKCMGSSKPEAMERLQMANAIRNRIMHPVKGISDYECDYRFLRSFERDLGRAEAERQLSYAANGVRADIVRTA
jgi:predicted transcriptional regulator